MIETLIVIVLVVIFLVLSGIHFYSRQAAKTGVDESVPTNLNNVKVINPKLFECFVVAVGLLGFGLLVLIKSKILTLTLPGWLQIYGLCAVAALFLLRAIGDFNYMGFFKKIKTTEFGRLDTLYYSPLCLLVGGLTLILALIK